MNCKSKAMSDLVCLVFINEKVCLKFVFILCGHKNFIIPGFLGSLKRHLTFIFPGDMEGISFNPFKAYSGISFLSKENILGKTVLDVQILGHVELSHLIIPNTNQIQILIMDTDSKSL